MATGIGYKILRTDLGSPFAPVQYELGRWSDPKKTGVISLFSTFEAALKFYEEVEENIHADIEIYECQYKASWLNWFCLRKNVVLAKKIRVMKRKDA